MLLETVNLYMKVGASKAGITFTRVNKSEKGTRRSPKHMRRVLLTGSNKEKIKLNLPHFCELIKIK